MTRFLFFLPMLLLVAGLQAGPVDEVRSFVGTSPHGHTFPGPTLPFGLVQLSPDTGTVGWDWSSGYNWLDTTIIGFSHTHLSGTGIGDLGDILLQPTVGPLRWEEGDPKVPHSGYRSSFSHDHETARPGYYQVLLEDSGINVELTATLHAGFHRYTFPAADSAHILIDLNHGINNHATDSVLNVESPTIISGYRRSAGWAHDKTYYFVAEFSKPIISTTFQVDLTVLPNVKSVRGKSVQAYLNFQTQAGEKVLVKVGISPTGIEEARKNLAAEIPGWDFDGTVTAARKVWNDHLSVVTAESADPAVVRTFYTALYHSMIAPNLFNNADGSYPGADHQVHNASFQYYQTFSFWDTFRAEDPMITLLQPGRVNDIVNTELAFYDQLGQHSLPIWPLASNETWCMIAYHSVPVIVDAYRKGFRGYDAEKAYAAMRDTAMNDRNGQDFYRRLGYIPADHREGTSRTLETAYDDWTIAQMARALGKTDDAALFAQRAQNYRNVYDPATGFMRGRMADGSWKTPFNPKDCTSDLTEADAWQYLFFVPQDVPGLIGLMGGDAPFVAKLDKMFDESSDILHAPIDISGRIGQYSQGDEQSHHVAYLYDYAGVPFKTQAHVRQVMSELYTDAPDGLCGNDDCGQMSAWYVLSAMGFYPVSPTSGVYAIGSPLLNKATIRLDPKYYPGGSFTIVAENNGPQNLYIQSATLNGNPLDRCWFSQEELAKGGTLILKMGPQPNPRWASAPEAMSPADTPFH